jgi:hypothetical protein
VAVITRQQSETETGQLGVALRAAEHAGDPAREVAAIEAALAHPCRARVRPAEEESRLPCSWSWVL